MNLALYLLNRARLARKQRELKALQHWIWQVTDQIASGQEALAKAKQRELQLEAEILGLESPDEISRRHAV